MVTQTHNTIDKSSDINGQHWCARNQNKSPGGWDWSTWVCVDLLSSNLNDLFSSFILQLSILFDKSLQFSLDNSLVILADNYFVLDEILNSNTISMRATSLTNSFSARSLSRIQTQCPLVENCSCNIYSQGQSRWCSGCVFFGCGHEGSMNHCCYCYGPISLVSPFMDHHYDGHNVPAGPRPHRLTELASARLGRAKGHGGMSTPWHQQVKHCSRAYIEAASITHGPHTGE